MKIIVNCGPCEPFIGKCLNSIQQQTVTDWQVLLTVDPSGDDTYNQALQASGADERIDVHLNSSRRYSLANLVSAVERSGAEPDDVIVVLDGDDWLNRKDALARLVAAYRADDCWLTYGSWVAEPTEPEGRPRGMWPAYPADTSDFRTAPWLASHLRSWKKWLWDLLDDRDLRDDDGRYFRVATDLAVMIPLLEMAGTRRARHIAEPLYRLRRGYAERTSDERYREQQRNDRIIRGRMPYQRLAERPRERVRAVLPASVQD